MGIDFIDDAWNDAVDVFEAVLTAPARFDEFMWEEVSAPSLEATANMLGFDDEVLYFAALNTNKLFLDTPPDNLAITLYAAILRNEDISIALRRLILTGTIASAAKYYEYGRDTFINGLPTISRKFRQINTTELALILEDIEGEPITLIEYGVGIPSQDIWAKQYLEVNSGYMDDTREITIAGVIWFYDYALRDDITGLTTVYVSRDVTILVAIYAYTITSITPGNEYTEVTYVQHTTITSSIPADTQVLIEHLGTVTNNKILSTPETGNFTLTFEEVVGFIGVGSVAESCIINISGTYVATQDSTDLTENSVLDYLLPAPDTVAYYYAAYAAESTPLLKRHWVYSLDSTTYPNLAGDLYTSEYPELLTMPVVALKKSFVTLNSTHPDYASSEALLKIIGVPIEELTTAIAENPDADKIRDAFFVMSINLYTQSAGGLDYLFKFFNGLAEISVVTKSMYETSTEGVYDLASAITIYPPGDMNTFVISEGDYNVTINYNYMTVTEYTGSIGALYSCTSEYDALPRDPVSGYMQSTFTIRWQFSASMYREIFIHGLFLATYLKHTDSSTDLQVTVISNDVTAQQNFEIPLVLPTLQVYDYRLADALIYEALTLQTYAADDAHLRYYQTEDFLAFVEIVIKVVAVVLLVWSLGTASDLSAALWILAEALLVQYALTLTLEYILENSSSDAVRYVAILLYAAASAYYSLGTGTDLISIPGLLAMVSAVSNAVNIYIAVEADEFNTDVAAFLESAEDRQEEIDKVADLLSTDSYINFWDITRVTRNNTNETPTEFFYRTGLSNPGVLSLDGPSNYVDSKLTLPKYVPSIT